MISKERKQEIMAEVAYLINKWINKQSLESMALEDLDADEADWYRENCFGSYEVEWWRFEVYNKQEKLIKTLDKAMTEDEADDYAHELLHGYRASLVWHDRVSNIEENK